VPFTQGFPIIISGSTLIPSGSFIGNNLSDNSRCAQAFACQRLNSNKGTKCEIGIKKSTRRMLNRSEALWVAYPFSALPIHTPPFTPRVAGGRRIDLFRAATNRFLRSPVEKNRHCSVHRCKMRSFKTAASMILRGCLKSPEISTLTVRA